MIFTAGGPAWAARLPTRRQPDATPNDPWDGAPGRAARLRPGARADRPASLVERGAGQAGDRRLRARHHRQGRAEVRAAGGAHRHLRQRRHALGRAADLHAGDVRHRPGGGPGPQASGVEGAGALQGHPEPRPRGDGEVHHPGHREDRRGDPQRHDGGGLRGNREGVACRREASALQAPLHRAGLPADARGDAVPARERLQDVHRDRRRPGVRARLSPSRSTACRRSR